MNKLKKEYFKTVKEKVENLTLFVLYTELGMSLTEIAEHKGVDKSTISRNMKKITADEKLTKELARYFR